MDSKRWIRWFATAAVPRIGLRLQARLGDPLAQIIMPLDGKGDVYRSAERIRDAGRIVRGRNSWVTADHELCREILRDKRFGVLTADRMELPGMLARLIDATRPELLNPSEPPSMIRVDPPDHTRYRRSVSDAFTPRAQAAFQARMLQLTDELLDSLDGELYAERIDEFAAQLPVAVIAEKLGLPAEVRPQLREWADASAVLLRVGAPWGAYRAATDSLRDAERFYRGHIAALRRRPSDDLLSRVTVDTDLDDREIAAVAMLLADAAIETAGGIIRNGAYQLLRHPGQLYRLRASAELWPNAVEEILRFDTSLPMLGRSALVDVELAGTTIRAGQSVALLIAGANRDPGVFPEPAVFEIARPNAKAHLSFGFGIHACLGSALARSQAVCALPRLFDRFKSNKCGDRVRPSLPMGRHGLVRRGTCNEP
ncbi:cytochrome P450 [Nocardia sp. CA-128927]|uniref:cytochrome P450 n=1 Tax=Nocardia sp. CA-128927 TaxID=3239975 RepID=UPI003D987A6F